MTKYFNFEDNIFYINKIIRNLGDSFKLQLDPDLFTEYYSEMISFIDLSLNHLFQHLQDNPQSMNIMEYRHSLMRTKVKFIEVLEECLAQSGSFLDGNLSNKENQWKSIIKQHRDDKSLLQDLLSKVSNENHENMITSAEMEVLFHQEQEDTF